MHVSVSVCCSRDTEGQVHIHRVFCVVEVYSSESISHQLPLFEIYTQHSTPPPTVATFPNRQYLVAVLLTKRAPHSPMQKAPSFPPANHGSGPPASHDPLSLCLQLVSRSQTAILFQLRPHKSGGGAGIKWRSGWYARLVYSTGEDLQGTSKHAQ